MVAAGDAVERLFRLFGPLGGVPDKVWSDPYAMGWVTGYANTAVEIYAGANHASLGDLDNVARGQIISAGWERVTPKDRQMEVLRRCQSFVNSLDPEYQRGFEAAKKTLLYEAGFQDDPNDLDIASATKRANMLAQGGLYEGLSERSAVAGSLTARLFYEVVT